MLENPPTLTSIYFIQTCKFTNSDVAFCVFWAILKKAFTLLKHHDLFLQSRSNSSVLPTNQHPPSSGKHFRNKSSS